MTAFAFTPIFPRFSKPLLAAPNRKHGKEELIFASGSGREGSISYHMLMLLSHTIEPRKGVLVALCALGAVALLFLAIYPPLTVPAEDAVILHQFSRNLAETGTISFIPHGPPAEGATDFLWMVYIAVAIKIGLSPPVATLIANLISIVALAAILLRMAGKRSTALKVLAIVGVIALFPQIEGAARGFSVLPFGLAITLTIMAALEGNDVLTAASALVLCLLRPDGVVFAVPIIFFIRILPSRNRARSLALYGMIYILPGLLYFTWRSHYFHELLPLPFLVKSNDSRMLGLFIPHSALALLPYVCFTAVILLLTLGDRLRERENGLLVLVLLAIPTVFYANIRLEQNLNDRFFFFYPLGILILLARSIQSPRENAPRISRKSALWIACAAYVVLIGFSTARSVAGTLVNWSEWTRLRDLASELNTPVLRGRMLTSEAGLLPYFSRWEAYDSWGLNTAAYARRIIQPEQVVELHPDIIILHGSQGEQSCTSKVQTASVHRDWTSMKNNVQSGIAMLDNYEAWQVPYWPAEKEDRMVRVQHLPPDMQCWYILRTYKGREVLEGILPRYQGTLLSEAGR